MINETWIDDQKTNDNEYSIDSYMSIRQNRSASRGGGNILYYRNHLAVTEIHRNDNLEYFWVRWQLPHSDHYIALAYRPPSAGNDIFDSLSADIERISARTPRAKFTVVGDLNMHNADWLGGTCLDNNAGLEGKLFASIHGLEQIVEECTRSYSHDNEIRWSKPDVFLTDSDDDFAFITTDANIGRSDHAVVVTRVLGGNGNQRMDSRKTVRSYSKANWEDMKEWLAQVNWREILRHDPDTAWVGMKKILHSAIEMFVPENVIDTNRAKPWFNNELRILLRAKLLSYRIHKDDPTGSSRHQYVTCRNNYNKAVRRQKKVYASSVAISLDQKSGRPWWKSVNKVIGRATTDNVIPPLDVEGRPVSDPKEKANCFNRFFAAKSTVPDPERPCEDQHVDGDTPFIRRITFKSKIVAKLLRDIDSSKAMGIDGIPGIVLKNCAKELCWPLARLFQKSFDTATVPAEWKCSKIIPIHKKKSRSDVSNYRPISLLPLVSKIMERYISYHLTKFLECNDKLTKYQFGFRAGHCTVHPLILLHQLTSDVLDKTMEARLLAFDIAGAFDTVWHKRLLLKAESMGISGMLLAWLRNYLHHRKQRVCVDGHMSAPADVKAGVPQGSILGPLLFIIFINDLPSSIDNLPLMFADDLSIFGTVPSCADRDSIWGSMQDDIERILRWADNNQMKFAPEKTQSLLISRRKGKENNKQFSINDTKVAAAQDLRLLGVTFSSNGKVTKHILEKAKTASKLVGMLRRFKQYLSATARRHLYVALIRPLMEYGSPVFVNAPGYAIAALDRVQRSAHKLFPSHQLDSLSHRRDIAGLCLLYKICRDTAPTLLCDRMKPANRVPQRSTRQAIHANGCQLVIPKSRSEHHLRSFMPYFTRLWNGLPNIVVQESSLQRFKVAANVELRRRSVAGHLHSDSPCVG